MSEHRVIVCLPSGAGGRTATLADWVALPGWDALAGWDASAGWDHLADWVASGAAESGPRRWHEARPGMWGP